jgi:hypothetical protein
MAASSERTPVGDPCQGAAGDGDRHAAAVSLAEPSDGQGSELAAKEELAFQTAPLWASLGGLLAAMLTCAPPPVLLAAKRLLRSWV